MLLIEQEALAKRAAQEAVTEAFIRLGIHDEHAGRDIEELRSLLAAWRDTKKTARRTIIAWGVRIFLAAIVISVGIKTQTIILPTGK
jgi:hypothetical protein